MRPLERKAWLRERQLGIGATDIASIVGVGFQDAAAVYEEKIAPEPIEREPSPLMLLGLATEEMNAQAFAAKTGAAVERIGLIRSPSCPFLAATLDYQVCGYRGEVIDLRAGIGEPIDTKYVGPFFGDSWGGEFTDEVPDGYVVQLTWQIQALRDQGCSINRGHVSALSGAGEHRAYQIPFDPRLATMLLELGAAFWKLVESRSIAQGWSHPLQAEVANRLESLRPDVSIELGEQELATTLAFQAAKEREKEAKREADELKAALLKALAGAGEGRLPDGTRLAQKIVHRKSYTVEATSYVDFRVHKPKKAKVTT